IRSVVVAHLDERYDGFDEDMLLDTERRLAAAVEAAPSCPLLLDFGRTAYFSSAMLEVLIRVRRHVERHPGGKIAVCALQPYCRDILETTRVLRVWPDFATVADGVAALGSG